MYRNEESRFAYNPTANIQRSRFKRDSSVKLTFDAAQLIPFYFDEVLPGDTMSIDTSKIIRLQTPVTPFMDNLYVDIYWFFVPNRLCWTHWKEFMGENSNGYWYPTTQYTIPQMKFNYNYDCAAKSVADYLGIPPNQCIASGDEFTVSALPFRAYGLIYNEWFRDQNLIAPDNVYLGDSTEVSDYNVSSYKGEPYKVSKYHDYFTSCLPAPQKGPAVEIPGTTFGGAPVVTGVDHDIYSLDATGKPVSTLESMRMSLNDGTYDSASYRIGVTGNSGNVKGESSYSSLGGNDYFPSNLYADMNGIGFTTTVNQLRLAFQIQKLYERDARGGSRYVEILKSHFNVTSPDYRLQRPEYLGGNRIPININQVIQNSESSNTSPLGNTGAMSLTSDIHSDFTKSFTEHGIIMGVLCARYDHTYQQGAERYWFKQDRFDFYWPVLANISEQPVYTREIYLTGTNTDNYVFGYSEPWADYRYKQNRVCAEFRSNYATSLDVWHLADDYLSRPHLSQAWIQEDPNTVDRVLAIQSNVANQFFADIYVKNMSTRPMPVYSIPGLIDHH